MSWVTFIWAMVVSACLTLAGVQGLVWLRRRDAIGHALFALLAVGTALMAWTELWMMHAETPAGFGRAMRWLFAAAWLVTVALVGFVWFYLRAGRPWLAWTVVGARTLAVIINFALPPNLGYRVITGVRRIPFLGEPVSVAVGVPSPWMLFAQFSLLLVVAFAVDAAHSVWRRGDHGPAVLVGGSVVLFALTGSAQPILSFWHVLSMPETPSVFFMAIVLAMSFELSRDLFKAAEVGRQLQVSQRYLVASQREAQKLSGRLISAQEDERSRLARAMHDGLSQSMALLAVELEMLGQQPPDPRQVTGRMEDFSAQVKALSADVHRLAHGLHPAKLEQLGLATAMSGHCRDVERAHAIAIQCDCRDVPRFLPSDVALCLYRVTQEALQNVVKHSGATRATVELSGGDRELRLSISDDGKGFDPEAAQAAEGLGLLSMRERVRLVHGRIQWRSQPGAGTRVDVCIPMPAPGESG
ncbi:MAG TPA: sensor histidine kinase [Thermoanaerobaculia bacterium]|nr:sensor histidine kinase [Thermoanaerobaculia bacterium]